MLNNYILYLHTVSEIRITLGNYEITLKNQQLQEDTYLKFKIVYLLSACILNSVVILNLPNKLPQTTAR